MNLYNNSSEEAAFWLSKYFKVVVLQLESANYKEAMDDLKWLNDQVFNFFHKSPKHVKAILDPRNQFTKIETWQAPDFNDVEVINRPIENERGSGQIPQISPESFYPKSNTEFTDELINGVYEVYTTSRHKDITLGQFARYILNNVLIQISNTLDHNDQFDRKGYLINSFFRRIYLKNYEIVLQNSNAGAATEICYHTGVRLSLGLLDRVDLKVELVKPFCNDILRSLVLFIEKEKTDYFKWFVQAIINGGYAAKSSMYQLSTLRVFLTRQGVDLESLEYLFDDLDRSMGITVFSIETYNHVIQRLELLEAGIAKLEIFDKTMQSLLDDTKEYFRSKYVEYEIALLILKLQVYLIFRENFDLIYYLHEYNQPDDSDARFSNKEPFPVYLNEVLDWVDQAKQLETELFELNLIGDHHGISPYIDLTWLISLVFSFRIQWKLYISREDILRAFIKNLSSRSDFENYRTLFEGLQRKFRLERKRHRLFEKFNEEMKDGVDQMFTSLLNRIKEREEDLQSSAPLNRELLVRKIHDSIDLYYRNRFYADESILGEGVTQEQTEEDHEFGVNIVIDRGYFVQNFETPIHGLSDNWARQLYEVEDLSIGSSLVQKLDRKDKIQINEIEEIINPLLTEDYSIIAKNLYLFDIPWDDSTKFEFDHSNQNHLYAGKINGKEIFSYRGFGNPAIIIVDKTKKGRIKNVVTKQWTDQGFSLFRDIHYKFIDLSLFENAQVLEQLLKKGGEGERQRLKRSIWIRILKRVRYENNNSSIGFFYELEGA